ncbi:MAG: hypothetical protein ACU826_04615 [Gammaproteobacteria bacterium]
MEAAIIVFAAFILWLGTKILDKAGFHKAYVLVLLIPVVNVIMIWIFAFTKWPNVTKIDRNQSGGYYP